MAIYLTAGAVEKLANGDVRSEIQMMPVLHVLKSTISVVNRLEAAVLWLTDGQGHEIRALLKGDLNLVKDKIVGSGSNIQLLQFTTRTSRVFQGQRFVSIIAMNVIISSSDVIGQPHSDVIGQPQGPQQNFDVEPLVDKMAIYLTAGAVEKLANGDVRSEIQMMSVLHVLKSTISVVNRLEAAVLWLTDGQGHEIRALLKGDLNLVKDKIVGSGSNIQLLQFTTRTSRVFQGQRFVSIIAMNVIISSSDVIGQPHSDVIGQPQGPQQNFDVEPLVDKMAIYLTAGAVEKLANGDVRSEIQMMPVLHVLKSTISVVNRLEAAVLWLTDGQGHEIRALLKAKVNSTGSSGELKELNITTGSKNLVFHQVQITLK